MYKDVRETEFFNSPFLITFTTLLVERAIIHPLETTYITQQKRDCNFLQAAKFIYMNKGPIGYYAGIMPMLLASLPLQLSLFGVYNTMRKRLENTLPNPAIRNGLCGVIAGFTCSLILTPIEAIRLRETFKLSPIMNKKEFFFVLVKSKQLQLTSEKINGLYRGYSIVLLRLTSFGMLTLASSTTFYQYLDPYKKNPFLQFLITMAFGMVNTTITTPLDNIRIKHYFANEGENKTNIAKVARQVYQNKMLFNGLLPRWVRFTVGPAIILTISEYLLSISKKSSPPSQPSSKKEPATKQKEINSYRATINSYNNNTTTYLFFNMKRVHQNTLSKQNFTKEVHLWKKCFP